MPVLSLRSRTAKAGACVAVALVVVGALFVGFGTNVFGPDRFCHGWISQADADRALPGTGKLSGSDDSASSCTVERSGWWPGSEKARLTVMVTSEKSRFPFERSVWKISGSSAVLAGKTPGSVDDRGGWALLPQACAGAVAGTGSGERAAVRVSLSNGTADVEGTASVLSSVARAVSREQRCGGPDTAGPTAGKVLRASAVGESEPGAVCGIPGFSLPGLRGPDDAPVLEQTSGSFDSAWFCDLSFSGDEKNGPFTRLAVVKDPGLTASLEDTGVTRTVCGGEETYFVLDNASYPWEPEERAAAGLPSEPELRDMFVEKVRASAACA